MRRLITIILGSILFVLSCSKPIELMKDEPMLVLKGTAELNEVGSERNQIPVSFSTNQSWVVTLNAQWISLSSEEGSAGDVAIIATIDENKSDKSRTGSITIAAGSLSKTLIVFQSGRTDTSGGETTSTLEISVMNINATSCDVYITNKSVRLYGWGCVKLSKWETSGGETIWKDLVSSYKDSGELDKFLITSSDSYKFDGVLESNAKYIVFASYSDRDGEREGEFVTEQFITNEEANKKVIKEVYIDSNLALPIGSNGQMAIWGSYVGYDYSEEIDNSLVVWKSSNTSIAKVDQTGLVTAVGLGCATITASAIQGNATDEKRIFVVDDFDKPVDLGLSIKWAQCNVGAKTPEKVGYIFYWGGTAPLSSSSWNWVGVPFNGGKSEFSRSYWDSARCAIVDDDNNLLRTNDTAYRKIGGNWRMPTKDEFSELFENCQQERTTLNGESGLLLTGKKNGYNDRWVFLSDRHKWEYDDVYPLYWSATINDKRSTWGEEYKTAYGVLVNYNSTNEVDVYERNDVGSVRPVYDDAPYLDIAVSNATSSACNISFSTNSSSTYYWVVLNKSYADKYGAELLCKALILDLKDNGTLNESLYSGNKSFKYIDLDPHVEYVVLSIFCNANGETTGKVHSKTFITTA